MFDLGWFEMAVIGALLLVVVGPKDLPKVLRTAGYWMGKARSMARDFQRSLDQYAKEAELDDVKKGHGQVECPQDHPEHDRPQGRDQERTDGNR